MSEILVPNFNIHSTIDTPDLIPDGIKAINAPDFWDKSNMGEGRVIAIIDTGCDVTHPDLADRILEVKNFTSDDNSDSKIVNDYVGHGTHVAGIIAANSNKSGIIGVAPKAKLIILKALSTNGGKYTDLIQALRYAISKKVDVINLSLGSPANYPLLESMINLAVAKNISVVCAAGNEGDGNPSTYEYSYPAYYVNSISVGAIDSSNRPTSFTESNNTIDLTAPGLNIYSAAPGGKYVLLSGTSMACPHVAGAIALIKNWSKITFNRELNETEIYAQLIKMTHSLGYSKYLEGSGSLFLESR